ncbi:MAG TPA: alpha/beta hydrolase [Stellaceae bacterium]|jgi:acetyl esterase/lipase
MSLRAEIVRLGTRWLLKGRGAGTGAPERRRRIAAAGRLVPSPPPTTRTTGVEAGGVAAESVAAAASQDDRHILYLHGGGFAIGSASLYRHLTWRLSAAARARLLAIDYRLAPEHPFPAALDDALAAYRWLLSQGADPRRVAVIGDSAGGGLVFSLLLRCRDERRLPLPACAAALSPWTDLALSGASLRVNARADPFIDASDMPLLAGWYLAGADPRNPYASPLYGDPHGLPPTLIQVGSDEVLRDDATRMADRMRAAGCEVVLEIWPRMPHVWQLFAEVMPEARRAIAGIGAFVRQRTEITTG